MSLYIHYYAFKNIIICMFLGSDFSNKKKSPVSVIYGMDNGGLAGVSVQADGTYAYSWAIDDSIKKSPVTCKYKIYIYMYLCVSVNNRCRLCLCYTYNSWLLFYLLIVVLFLLLKSLPLMLSSINLSFNVIINMHLQV